MGAFDNVSWNKPFGDSAASSLLGGGGGISSMLNGVSWDHPLGTDSFLGQSLYGNQSAPLNSNGVDKNGNQVIVPGTHGSSDNNTPQFGGGFVQQKSTNLPSSIPSAWSPRGPGAMPNYLPNQAELDFRDAYSKSLKPNVNFAIAGEASPYKAIPSSPFTDNAGGTSKGGK